MAQKSLKVHGNRAFDRVPAFLEAPMLAVITAEHGAVLTAAVPRPNLLFLVMPLHPEQL